MHDEDDRSASNEASELRCRRPMENRYALSLRLPILQRTRFLTSRTAITMYSSPLQKMPEEISQANA